MLAEAAVAGCIGHLIGARRHHANRVQGKSELLGGNLPDLRDETLAHLRAAMIHLYAAVAIDQHQRAALIEKCGGERNAELYGSDGDSAFAVRMLEVEASDVGSPLGEPAALHQLPPEDRDARRVFHRLAVVRGLPFPVEVPFAHHLGSKSQPPRSLVEHAFDHHHPLRTAETPERGLRRLIRPAYEARHVDRGQVVAIIHVEHRAPHHRLREVEAPATVGIQLQHETAQPAIVVEPGAVSSEKRMPLSGERDVERARQSHAHRPASFPRAQSGQRRPHIRLRLLAAEGAAHAQTLDRDLAAWDPEHLRGDGLGFAGMLRRGIDGYATRFVQPCDGALRLQIKMLLTADSQLAVKLMRAGVDGGLRVAALQPQRPDVKSAGFDGLLDAEHGRQRPIFHAHSRSAEPGSLQAFGQHPRDRLAEVHYLGREQRLVMPRHARVVRARYIGGGERGHHAGLFHGRGGIQLLDDRVRVRRKHRPGVQNSGEAPGQVVRVQRLTRDMAVRAFVRYRIAHQSHAAASVCCSHQNFSSRFCASASRYFADPR